mmetsp:Transcript_17192/g.24322  ORF Transcript_17192/g.24322 Transcript_17192/m.24322 type:complete len:444 (+) Transcript_17192:144-1475(+)
MDSDDESSSSSFSDSAASRMDVDDGISYEEPGPLHNADEELFNDVWQEIAENDPVTTALNLYGGENYVQNIITLDWLRLGRDISNNTHLTEAILYGGALNDEKMSFFFRGLTKSSSIAEMYLYSNGFSVAGVRSMVPFLQNATNLMHLDLNDNNLRSDGFIELCRALSDSPIVELHCDRCGIESIEIGNDCFPKQLLELHLRSNNINVDGCRELAKLLQGGSAILVRLYLEDNNIDDEGVGILVDGLRNNTSLDSLDLRSNNGISTHGQVMLLRLVNDISSIKATFQSNHKLMCLNVNFSNAGQHIQTHIDQAVGINEEEDNPAAAARAKVIKSQLHSGVRAELADLQGVSQSVYSEINPLHLPEVIALVGKNHGQGELYAALKSSIAGVISTVNRKQCLQQEKAYYNAKIAEYRAKVEEVEAELATIDAVEGNAGAMGSETQ